jgi:putative effector of murein hydrolase LrgA (UPF0299 family)
MVLSTETKLGFLFVPLNWQIESYTHCIHRHCLYIFVTIKYVCIIICRSKKLYINNEGVELRDYIALI